MAGPDRGLGTRPVEHALDKADWERARHGARTDVVVRDGTEDDLEAVAAVKVQGWAETYLPLIDPDVLRPLLGPEQHLTRLRRLIQRAATLLLVAVGPLEPRRIVGFALTDMAHKPEPLLESLHVAASVRSQGIGELLIRETAARVAARGYTSLQLDVVEANRAASRFYERLGGVLVRVEPHAWGTGSVPSAIYRWPDIAALTEI